MAGQYSEIGKQILDVGSKRAKLICTGNWEYDLEGTNKKRMSDASFWQPKMEKVTNVNV